EAEVRLTEQEPVPPAVVQLAGLTEPGPLTTVKLITVPSGAFTKPLPSFTFTCAVNVCGVPTSFVAVNGEIWMFASTQLLAAFALSPAFPSPVERVSGTPPTEPIVDAFSVATPAVEEVRLTEHEPVPPAVVQLAGLTEPGPVTTVKLIVVPFGAVTKPLPSFTFTCAVNVCGVPTSFVAVKGDSGMFASTQVLTP